MVRTLVLKHFDRPWLGHTIKANFITFHAADPEIDSTLIFTKESGASFSSTFVCDLREKYFLCYILLTD